MSPGLMRDETGGLVNESYFKFYFLFETVS